MNVFVTAPIVFGSLFGAVLLGMRLRSTVPAHHLSSEAKDAVRIGMGLVATMAALVLGLLVASTKTAYDSEKNEVTQMAARIDFLDRTLANYGPEAAESRALLRRGVEVALARMWPEQKSQHAQRDSGGSWTEALPNAIQKLSPENDVQRAFKAQAADLASDLGQMRWLLYEQAESSISIPMLIVVIAWLTIIFVSVGLFAPSNPTVVIALALAALSVSGAIALILELDLPFDGIIQISSAPMRNALEHLGR